MNSMIKSHCYTISRRGHSDKLTVWYTSIDANGREIGYQAISEHPSMPEAKAAKARYEAADKRRANR